MTYTFDEVENVVARLKRRADEYSVAHGDSNLMMSAHSILSELMEDMLRGPNNEPSRAQCAAITLEICKVKGRDYAVKLLAKYEARNIAVLQPEFFADFLLDAQGILKGETNDEHLR